MIDDQLGLKKSHYSLAFDEQTVISFLEKSKKPKTEQ